MRLTHLAVLAAATLLLASCKEQLNPHKAPEADADLVVLLNASKARNSQPDLASASKKVVLSINNYPGANEPLEQDVVQREFEAFEKANPNIRIEFSTWRFTPESFFERAQNRMLTDIVEVNAAQIPAIIDLNYAADITDLITVEPEYGNINPQVMEFLARDSRVYGVPIELNTMALFYNRKIFDGTASATATTATVSPSAKKGKGADGDPRDYLVTDFPDPPARELTQFWPFRRKGQQSQEQQEASRQNQTQPLRPDGRYPQPVRRTRGEESVRDYYNLPNQPGARNTAPGSYYDTQQYSTDPRAPRRPADGRSIDDDIAQPEGEESIQPSSASGSKQRRTIEDDILTTGDETFLAESGEPRRDANETTIVLSTGAPSTWVEFVRLAVKHTNHAGLGVFGYAPVMFAEGGGREFSQWGVQAGLQIAAASGDVMSLDVNTSTAAEVTQFLKDLRWRYDVTPPIDRCYADNVVRMFGEGRVAMCMLPANAETIRRLLRLGMPLDAIGIAPLPQGPKNRKHLASGKCLIINAQLDREKRAAAVKWLMFKMNPETFKARQQYYYREQEMTGGPTVPLFRKPVQDALYQSTRPYRTLPLYADYEREVAGFITPEPGFFTEQLYAAIATDVRPIVAQKNSVPETAIVNVASDFKAKYLSDAPSRTGLQRYLDRLAEFARQ
ncbi:hypothetical protein CVU37_08030 [candidate division BRC1 bacterium HGW-BRC1-1]|jgi:ABC-type glycerol-3-phosphate transport system substrate-binding protein|nr:MAG: hypothetical protein CVU37_08030 [candidate division BRC1 bacterium HGW-BRC1-1]